MVRSATRIPLPPYRHLPGLNARPAEDFLNALAVFDDCPISDVTAAHHLRWRYGLHLINERYFWEAHEALEPVWWHAAANSPERHLVQTSIHLTNGALKLTLGRANAAHRLAAMATQSCERAFTGHLDQLLGLKKSPVLMAATSIAAGVSTIELMPNYAL